MEMLEEEPDNSPRVWRIRHIPTGLFFKPSPAGYKCNLSQMGKMYYNKPSLRYVSQYGKYYHPVPAKDKVNGENPRRPFVESEWEIVTYTVSELIQKDIEEVDRKAAQKAVS